MKATIHPKYVEVTVSCACGEILKLARQKARTSVWKSAPSAILSLQANKN